MSQLLLQTNVFHFDNILFQPVQRNLEQVILLFNIVFLFKVLILSLTLLHCLGMFEVLGDVVIKSILLPASPRNVMKWMLVMIFDDSIEVL
jgi:hypothetical protein